MAKRQGGSSPADQDEAPRAQSEDPIPEIADDTRNMADDDDDDDEFEDDEDGEDTDDEDESDSEGNI